MFCLLLLALHPLPGLASDQPLLSLHPATVTSPACARPEFTSCQLASVNWDLLSLGNTFQLPSG